MRKNVRERFMGILTIWGIIFSFSSFAQNRQITGKISDPSDGSALPGVSVQVKGTSRGTTTDASGVYKIQASDNAVLVFSSVGYLKKEVKVSGQSVIDVTMESDVSQLDEIVVTALGQTQEKRALGYSVQEIKSDAIKNSGEQNLVGALQGKIAGAVITGSGGAPGSGVNIILRGITSLSSGSDNQPLFVVDGIIISNTTNAGNPLPSAGSSSPGASEQFGNTNRAADINPEDVEAISVLKGPAATALYGLRASNGAIIITTKRGKSGKLRVNVSSTVGIDNVSKTPDYQNRFIQGRFGEFISETEIAQRSIFRSFGPALMGDTNPNDKIYDNFRDFYRTGFRNNNNVSISKGGDKGNIYFSLGRNYQSGIIPNTDFERTSLKLAGLYNVTKSFSVSGSVNYVNSGGKRPPAGDKSIFSSLSYWPNSYDVNDYIKPDGSQKNITLGVVDNPRYLVEKSPRIDNVNRYIADIALNYAFNSWLSAKYQVTYDTYHETRSRTVDSTFDVGVQVKGFLVKEDLNFREINSNFYLTAKKSFNENWNGSVMVGNSIVDSKKPDSYYTRGERLLGSNPSEIGSYKNTETRFYSPGQYRIVSFFGDAKLNYKDVLYLNVTGRNDIVSTLPVQNNSFFYPSVSLGYVFTESLPKGNILSYGKLRASWAQVGKGADPYITSTYFAPVTNFPYNNNVPGYSRVTTTADPNLRPERTTSIEVGAELRFLKNRLSVDATYFTMDSKDQIVNAPVTNASGYANYYTNIGLIRNQGVELLVSGKPVQTKNFSWDVSVNWSKLSGKVLEMPPALQEIVYFDNTKTFLKVRQGSNLGDLWGFEYVKSPDGQTVIQANGFPLVSTTATKVGNAMPDWQGGLTNTITYKGLSLSFLLEWRQGGNVVDMAEENSVRNGITKFTERRYEQVVYKGVVAQKNTDGSTSYVPNTKLVYLDDNFYRSANQFYYWSGFTVQDGSWFRLRSVNISYSLPKKLIANSVFKNGVRFSFTGTNLFLNTPFRGYDPEALSFGSGTNRIGFVGRNNPSTRSFQFGVSVNF